MALWFDHRAGRRPHGRARRRRSYTYPSRMPDARTTRRTWSRPAILRPCRRDVSCSRQSVRSASRPLRHPFPPGRWRRRHPRRRAIRAMRSSGRTSSTARASPIRSTGPTSAGSCGTASCSGTRPQNARQADGLLIIEARRERVANPGYESAASDWRRSREFAEYSSASLMTRGLHSWRYGRFEMRGASTRGLDYGRRSGPSASPATGRTTARSTSWSIPRPAPRQCRVGRREALRGDLGRFAQADRQLPGRLVQPVSCLANGLGRARDRPVGGRRAAE